MTSARGIKCSWLFKASAATCLLAWGSVGSSLALAAGSMVRYTSIKESDCHDPPAILATHYRQRGLQAQECPGLKGQALLVVSSDGRSWLEWVAEGQVVSTERVVIEQTGFGYFPNLGADKVEWQLGTDGQPLGLIFRVTAQDMADASQSHSRLFVVSLRGGTDARSCGHAATNQGARQLLQQRARCVEPLLLRRLT